MKATRILEEKFSEPHISKNHTYTEGKAAAWSLSSIDDLDHMSFAPYCDSEPTTTAESYLPVIARHGSYRPLSQVPCSLFFSINEAQTDHFRHRGGWKSNAYAQACHLSN
jgi:hypothetical protein